MIVCFVYLFFCSLSRLIKIVIVCVSLFFQSWNVLALDGSNWQRIDLFNFQRDIEVSELKAFAVYFSLRGVGLI